MTQKPNSIFNSNLNPESAPPSDAMTPIASRTRARIRNTTLTPQPFRPQANESIIPDGNDAPSPIQSSPLHPSAQSLPPTPQIQSQLTSSPIHSQLPPNVAQANRNIVYHGFAQTKTAGRCMRAYCCWQSNDVSLSTRKATDDFEAIFRSAVSRTISAATSDTLIIHSSDLDLTASLNAVFAAAKAALPFPTLVSETLRHLFDQARRSNFEFKVLYVSPPYNTPSTEHARACLKERTPLHLDLLPLPVMSAHLCPAELLQAATRLKRNQWRSLPSHLVIQWSLLVDHLADDFLDSDLSMVATILAPAVFLDKLTSPTIQLLEVHLRDCVASQNRRKEELIKFCGLTAYPHSPQQPTPEIVNNKINRLVGLGAPRKAIEVAASLLPDSETSPSSFNINDVQKKFPPVRQ
jgi:hypothetical protein